MQEGGPRRPRVGVSNEEFRPDSEPLNHLL